MAQLCFACQTTTRNDAHVCPTCGRNLVETRRAWSRGEPAWRGYLDQTGWYPGRQDDLGGRYDVVIDTDPYARPRPPRRLTCVYLGGHPHLPSTGRVTLVRDGGRVLVARPGWWPGHAPRVAIDLASVRSVTSQVTTESSLDDAVMAAAIGGARTGPLGVALGTAIGRRRRVVRTVHVAQDVSGERLELVFRPQEKQGEVGFSALLRIFSRGYDRARGPSSEG